MSAAPHALPRCLDFFAGCGLVTEALTGVFDTVWANDLCSKKAAIYCANHDAAHFQLADICSIRGADLPAAELSWASFPCQDLSLAGPRTGLGAARSGLVWEWLRILDEMLVPAAVVALENVMGLLSAGAGEQYSVLHRELETRGYAPGALVLDGTRWTPQSRKRVFVVAVREQGSSLPGSLAGDGPNWLHPASAIRAAKLCRSWVWWKLPEPAACRESLADLIEWDAPLDSPEVTQRNLTQLAPLHAQRLHAALGNGFRVAAGYRRTRAGSPVIELRFDAKAGCLRTPGGGSARQLLLLRDSRGELRTRLLTVREAARLMGVRDTYLTPGTYSDGYRAMGDGVVVPAVRHLAQHLLQPLAIAAWPLAKAAELR